MWSFSLAFVILSLLCMLVVCILTNLNKGLIFYLFLYLFLHEGSLFV